MSHFETVVSVLKRTALQVGVGGRGLQMVKYTVKDRRGSETGLEVRREGLVLIVNHH